MKLVNAEGELELLVAENDYVDGTVRHTLGVWSFRASYCVLAHLSALADWFDAVAAGETPEMCYVGGFMCHEFLFQVRGGSYYTYYEENFAPPTPDLFRVMFGQRPPWCVSGWGYMDFPIEGSDLRAMAAELRANSLR